MSIKKDIEKGKSYYELVPLQGGGWIMQVWNYGRPVFNKPVCSEAEAKTTISTVFPGGVL